MSTLTSVRGIARPGTPSFSFGRAAALLAGIVAVGVETLVVRAELRRSRRQLAELDDRMLRDIGIDRARARFEADKGFWA
ncbi:MAG TPA: DUF1127 domain-containing protein [Reyranella sp.]|jgi:uncharacterized protein YjiS (DUF1127 family)|nr:DUF1127 domain-containing protein [Reyranella sp.]